MEHYEPAATAQVGTSTMSASDVHNLTEREQKVSNTSDTPPDANDIATSASEESEDVIPSHTDFWSEEKKAEFAEYVANQRIDAEPYMKEGMQVLMDYGKGPQFATLHAKGDFRTRTGRAMNTQLFGWPFQTTFSVEGRNLKLREGGALTASDVFEHLARDDPSFLPSATNAELFDDSQNQTLTEADIRKMKAEGKSGDEIIRAVAAASKTFDSKTEFSQEKWFKRKAAKYNTDISITRPTPQAVLHYMTEKDHRRIYYLRDDSLGQMIQKASIGAGSRAIVFDTVGGLVTASVAYRMGGFGTIIAPYVGLAASYSFINRMNLSKAERNSILHVPVSELLAFHPVNRCVDMGVSDEEIQAIAQANAELIANAEATEEDQEAEAEMQASMEDANDQESEEAKAADEEDTDATMDKPKGPTKHAIALKKVIERSRIELKQGATALIICTNHSPLEVLLPLLNLVMPSSPFVVYSITPEPLARAQNFLVQRKLAANVQIAEYWYRPIQVLPNRTHPHMTTSATGGYLLSGYTIAQ